MAKNRLPRYRRQRKKSSPPVKNSGSGHKALVLALEPTMPPEPVAVEYREPLDYFLRLFYLTIILVSPLMWFFVPYLVCIALPQYRGAVDTVFVHTAFVAVVVWVAGVFVLMARIKATRADALANFMILCPIILFLAFAEAIYYQITGKRFNL